MMGCKMVPMVPRHLQSAASSRSIIPAPVPLAGSAAYPWELSIRLARKDAGERLHSILELIASAADELGRVGWDAAPSGSWVQQA